MDKVGDSSNKWAEDIYWSHFQFTHFYQILAGGCEQQLVGFLSLIFPFVAFTNWVLAFDVGLLLDIRSCALVHLLLISCAFRDLSSQDSSFKFLASFLLYLVSWFGLESEYHLFSLCS